MPYTTRSFVQIRDDLIRDIKNLLPDADTSADSDYFIRASSVASAVEGLYQHQAWIVQQIFPDTADSEYLELHAQIRNILRKAAVGAAGTARATGTPGEAVPVGLVLRTTDNMTYEVAAAAQISPSGNVTVSIRAQATGEASNKASAMGSFIDVPLGINSAVTLITVLGGTDQESDIELLNRLLEQIRRPPAGGNKYDYRRWAMEIAGVTGAFVYPLRRGVGTVDIAIISGNDLPSAATIEAVQTYIDNVRPVTAKSSLVLAPTKKLVNISIQVKLQAVSIEQFEASFAAELENLFQSIEPGQELTRSRIETIASNLPGVLDRNLVAPSSNVTADVDDLVIEWIRLGTVTASAMP